jgi:hypothetical protein
VVQSLALECVRCGKHVKYVAVKCMCTESICVLLLYIVLYSLSKRYSDGIEQKDKHAVYMLNNTPQHSAQHIINLLVL